MAVIETWYNQDLQAPVAVHYLDGNVFSQDNLGNLIGVNVFDGGAPASIAGSVSASCIRADGATVAVAGSLSGNTVSVILPEAVYAVPGVLSIVIKLTGGGSTTTLCAVVAHVYQSATDTTVDPGTVIPSIQDLIDQIYNAIASIPADYSALLDAMTAKAVDISTSKVTGYFINSSGVIASTSGHYAYTMPIPVEKGKRYCFTGTGTTQIAAICSCDSSGGNRAVLYVYGATDTQETFYYVPKEDGYIGVSFNYDEYFALTSVDDVLPQIIEGKESLIDLASVEIGKDWTGGTAANRAVLDVLVEPNREYFISVPGSTNLYSVSIVEKDGNNTGSLKSTMVYHDTSLRFITTNKTTRVIIQFNGINAISSSDLSNYPIFMYKYNSADYFAVDGVARSTFGIKSNMIDLSQVEIGKNWAGGSASNRARCIIPVLPNHQYTIIVPASANWSTISLVQKKDQYAGSIASATINTSEEYKFITEATAYWLYIQFNGSSDITSAMFEGYNIYLFPGLSMYEEVDSVARENSVGWIDKKIVWLGTSIPAAGKDGLNNRHTYPAFVGDILRATVFNEAVGSSAIHCKIPSNISVSNPYGFMSNFEAVSRCITNSLAEMEWIIEHFNDSNVFTQNVPESLSDDDKAFIRSCSWENKIGKYLQAGKFPDLWVFDHGHNDNPTATSEATYTARTELTGTQNDGYYVNGAYVSSSASSYFEFDVAGIPEVWLTGTIGSGYDVYDLLDGNGNVIGYKTNASEKAFDSLFIDTSSASKLRISDPNNLISTIHVVKYTYGSMYNSLYSYQGGMDFLINKIKEYNPKAQIVIIGEYENQKFPLVSQYQMDVANRWEFPIYKQWEQLGFSQQLVKVDGVWKTYLEVYIPDGLHPHTDTTMFTMRLMAENIAAWLNTVRNGK